MRVIDLSTLSLVGGSGITEVKVPLWWADGTSVGNGNVLVSGSAFLNDGSSNTGNNGSPCQLFSTSSNWPSSMKCALEVSAYASNPSYAVYFALYDFTTSSVISVSQITTTADPMVVIRSSSFALSPNHKYGVTLWISTNSYAGYISDASLIIFP